MKVASRESYRRHRERRIAEVRAWKTANPEEAARHVRESKDRRPEHYAEQARIRCSRRRAVKKSVFVEDVHPLVVLERDDGVCGICGTDVNPYNFEVDHIIPLAAGGEHSYLNVQVAHPHCNRVKWMKSG